MIGAISSYFYPPKAAFGRTDVDQRLKEIQEQVMDILAPSEELSQEQQWQFSLAKAFHPNQSESELRRKYLPTVKVEVDPVLSSGFAAADISERKIVVHPLFLLKPDDLPEELRCTGPEDSHLKSKEYFKQLTKWMGEKFKLQKKDLIGMEKLFPIYLSIWESGEDPSHFKEFTIAHEAGHIFHKHGAFPWEILVGLVASSCAMVWFWGSLLLIPMVVVAYKVSVVVPRCLRMLYYRSQEKEADLFALKHVGSIKGAETVFENVDKIQKIVRKNLSWCATISLLVSQPEHFFPLSHPAPLDRIAYLKEAMV